MKIKKDKFKLMIVFFIIFSIADILMTNLGIRMGYAELNSFVLISGLGFWGIFRIGLLGYLVSTFFLGYRYCYKHSMYRALTVLKVSLLITNLYIAAILISNMFVLLGNVV